VAYLAPEMLKR